MIQIEKKITITIDGKDCRTLSHLCELARQNISQSQARDPDGRAAGGYSGAETREIESLIQKIFDNCGDF